MRNPKDVLLKILEIIEYTEDKDNFTDAFLKNIYLQSVSDLASNFTQDKELEVKSKLSQVDSPERLEEILRTHFTGEEINEALKTSSYNAIQEYIKTIDPTLSNEQKQSLRNYFQTLTPSQNKE